MISKQFLVTDLQRELGEIIVGVAALRKRMIKSEEDIKRQRVLIENLRRRMTDQNQRLARMRESIAHIHAPRAGSIG